ncbi:hypothetical protein Pfo_005328 [Paulownia fortunei]|nr:hypothetical protein Pfo_005328 [Paulownia fortunei]
MAREVSESCVESLLAEIVLSYCKGFYAKQPELAVRRFEAIGFQVRHQLSERSVRNIVWTISELFLLGIGRFLAVWWLPAHLEGRRYGTFAVSQDTVNSLTLSIRII